MSMIREHILYYIIKLYNTYGRIDATHVLVKVLES